MPLYRIINNAFVEIYDKASKCFRQLPLTNCEIVVKQSTMSEEEELINTKFYVDKYKEYGEIPLEYENEEGGDSEKKGGDSE